MSRSIDAATLTELEADTARPILFVELRIDETSSPQVITRLHTGVGTISWGGFDWVGAGELASINAVQEGSELSPNAIQLGLSGVDSTITNIVFNTEYYRRPVILYIGAFDSTGALVADPSVVFSGFIESIDMVVGSKEGDVVSLTAESELILFRRSKMLRYTDVRLQSEYSGDKGLEFLEATKNAKVVWRGEKQAAVGTSGGATGPGGRYTDYISGALRPGGIPR